MTESNKPVLVFGKFKPREVPELGIEGKVEGRYITGDLSFYSTGSRFIFRLRCTVVEVHVGAAERTLVRQSPFRQAGDELQCLIATAECSRISLAIFQ